MVLTLAGFVSEIDKWGRMIILFPRIRSSVDSYGTEAKLLALDIKGTSPINRNGYIVRPDDKTLYLISSRRVTQKEMLQRNVVIEVATNRYDFTAAGGSAGMSLKLISMRT